MAQLDPLDNLLLAELPDRIRHHICPYLKLVEFPAGTMVYEADEPIRQVYFPVSCIISLLKVMPTGESAEIAMVGKEGIVGIAAFMGSSSSTSRAIVQSRGWAYWLPATTLIRVFNEIAEVRKSFLHYTQTLMSQMAQTAVCNRHHSIEQRLCRWLLLSLDRLPDSNLEMTQELLARMLGVRRESVTEAAGKLQQLSVIRYSRGKITVLNRPLMEQLCCGCYSLDRVETRRLNNSHPSLLHPQL